jgi:hypothetical protein
MFRRKEKLMTNEEKVELVRLTELVYGPHGHAVLDMRSSIHRRLSELQRIANWTLTKSLNSKSTFWALALRNSNTLNTQRKGVGQQSHPLSHIWEMQLCD